MAVVYITYLTHKFDLADVVFFVMCFLWKERGG